MALSIYKYDKLLLKIKLQTQGHQSFLPVIYSWVKHLVPYDLISSLLYVLVLSEGQKKIHRLVDFMYAIGVV